jgi:hypothetical protein
VEEVMPMAEDYEKEEGIAELLRNSRPLEAECGRLAEGLLLFQMGLIVMAMQCGHDRVLSDETRRELEGRLSNLIEKKVKDLKRFVADMERLQRKLKA